MKELETLTEDQLQAELDRRQAAKKEEAKKAKENYESNRNELVTHLVESAIELNKQMRFFKQHAIDNLNDFGKEAFKYGDIRKHSKGGFSLRSADGTMKVALVRNTKQEYDERADLAEKHLRDFLADMVKKRDQNAYEIITALLERGKAGEFNPAAIAALIKMEDRYTDERWVQAIKLFKESHNLILISMNVEFYFKNRMDKDEAITLTFASIPIEQETEAEEVEK